MSEPRLTRLAGLATMRRDIALQDLALARAKGARLTGNLEDLAVQMHDAATARDVTGVPMLLQCEQFSAWIGVHSARTRAELALAEADAARLLAAARTAVGRTHVLQKLARRIEAEARQRDAKRL